MAKKISRSEQHTAHTIGKTNIPVKSIENEFEKRSFEQMISHAYTDKRRRRRSRRTSLIHYKESNEQKRCARQEIIADRSNCVKSNEDSIQSPFQINRTITISREEKEDLKMKLTVSPRPRRGNNVRSAASRLAATGKK